MVSVGNVSIRYVTLKICIFRFGLGVNGNMVVIGAPEWQSISSLKWVGDLDIRGSMWMGVAMMVWSFVVCNLHLNQCLLE